ncbi:MAG: hypothetical protein H0U97_19350 [Gammaproteobacteria bacterium]|nr:hypothetical protein [Gammaproteobacteria bacterium]
MDGTVLTLAFIGAEIAAVVVAGWQAHTHFAPSASTEKPSPTVTAGGANITTTQTSAGTITIGGVHGIRPEDYQRVSAELGVTQAALIGYVVKECRILAPDRTASARVSDRA